MAALVSCSKHIMVACLEKTEQNTQFHEIVDFLTRSLIYYSLTTISIFEASIRRDLQFNDVDGIGCLTNQEIYENLQLMGNLDAKKQFLIYPRFVQLFLNNQLSNLPAPLDNLPIPVLTEKVFTNMAKQGLHFSGHVTPLFPNMLAQAVVDKGQDPRENLEGTSRSQGDHVQIPLDSPLSSGHTSYRAEGGLNLDELLVLYTKLSTKVLALETSKDAEAVEILNLKTRIKKLENKCKPSISHHRAWLRRPKLDDSTFDDLDADLAHDAEDKGSGEKGGSTVSTSRPEVDTARPDIDNARPKVHTANAPVSTAGVTISTADLEVSDVESRTLPSSINWDQQFMVMILREFSLNPLRIKWWFMVESGGSMAVYGSKWWIKGVFGSLDPRILTTPSSSQKALDIV
ncbi:hypothetical protein Tco_1362172, partial [Tanacetum coccineum]